MNESDSLVTTELVMPPVPPLNNLDLLIIFGELFSVKEKVDDLISLKINNEGIQLVKTIVDRYPLIFNSISSKINEILKDGILNIDDVPVLVNLIKEVINTDIKSLKKILPSVEDVLLFLKTVLEILINKDYLEVENKEKVFKLLDVSFLLLSTSVDMKEDFFTCVRKMLKC